jgi:hypothetical protein
MVPATVGGEVAGAVGRAWLEGMAVGFPADGVRLDVVALADHSALLPPWSVSAYGICTSTPASWNVRGMNTELNSDIRKTATATCATGSRLRGTGAAVVNGDGSVRLDVLRPNATLTAVTAEAREGEGGYEGDWSLRVQAHCGPPPRGLERVAVSTAPQSEEYASVTAACPAGKHLIGTGGEIAAGFGQVGFDDLRPDAALTQTTVTATEDATGLASDWKATAYAICISP